MPATKRVYTVLFAFCGIGAGALGFLQAQHPDAEFKIIGGIDNDELACRDFEMLTGAPAYCLDVNAISPEKLRELFGDSPPDVVFLSPPCKGASGLLSEKDAQSPHYQAMNWLAYTWMVLMLAAWGNQRPRLVIFENVPRLKARAPKMLAEVKALLTEAGYLLHDGFHDCGVIGGLAQHRRRYLMIARHKSVEHLLYQPPTQRVRGCGEELGRLPLPGDPAAGPMHRLPDISWLNAIRLALIPAGGDWRDLPGVIPEGKKRYQVFKRKEVSVWEEPTETIAGPGSNGVENVADPRLAWFGNVLRLVPWDAPVGTITSAWSPSNGAASAADPRLTLPCLGSSTHHHLYRVTRWHVPVGTVTSATRPGQGAPSIADPRVGAFDGSYGVRAWGEPAATVTGGAAVSTGPFAVADGRLVPPSAAWRGILGVTPWNGPSRTVTANSTRAEHSSGGGIADPRIGLSYATRDGTFEIAPWGDPMRAVTGQSGRAGHCSGGLLADPRLPFGCEPRAGVYGVAGWASPSTTVIGSASPDTGTFAVADPRVPWLHLPRPAYPHAYRSLRWWEPSYTVASQTSVGCGAYAVADHRLWACLAFESDNPGRHWNKYHVGSWCTPAGAVIGAIQVGSGAPAVADPRAPELPPHLQGYEVMTWLEAAATLEGMPGADAPRRSKKGQGKTKKVKRSPWLNPTRPRPFPTLIVAADGTWHRPLTTLELAVLQGLPAVHHGKPLRLAGNSSQQREHIGNAVPVGAARAIAEQMLKTLATADEGGLFLSSSAVWVAPPQARVQAPTRTVSP